MPRSISPNKIAEIKPIIDKLDVEMAKPQAERKDFSIQSRNNPEGVRKLKSTIADWKLIHRPEWKFKLELRIKGDTLTFMFNRMSATNWNFVDTEKREGFEFVDAEEVQASNDGIIQELTDNKLAELLIMESPPLIVVDPNALSPHTLQWMVDQSSEITAVGRVLTKHGYVWRIYPHKVRIFLPGNE